MLYLDRTGAVRRNYPMPHTTATRREVVRAEQPLRTRTLVRMRDVLGGSALSIEGDARWLGITCAAVDERWRAGTLLAVPEDSERCYPVSQFQEDEVVPGLVEAVGGLAEVGPWVTLDILLASDTVLASRTPLQGLQARDPDAVLRLVRASQGDSFACRHAAIQSRGTA
jgi:hypothetical protein